MSINTFSQSAAAQAANEELARLKKAEIEKRPGGLKGFRANLVVDPVVDDKTHADLGAGFKGKVLQKVRAKLADFYGVYEKCFPIPDERESFKGFTEILTQGNFDEALKNKVGNYREFVYTLRDPDTKQVIGGMNFVAYLHNGGQPTMHSTYAFLAPEYRGLGLANQMFEIRDRIGINFLSQSPEGRAALKTFGGVYTFSEQNIPELMDGLSYVKDSSQAIDQVKRLQIWTKLGYSVAEFPYVQPALGEGFQPCDVLSLNTYRRPVKLSKDGAISLLPIERPRSLPAQALRDHLCAFFTQSVCKDPNTPETDDVTRKALADLDNRIAAGQAIKTTPLKDRLRYLSEWASQIGQLQDAHPNTRLNGTDTVQTMWDRFVLKSVGLTARRDPNMIAQRHQRALAAG